MPDFDVTVETVRSGTRLIRLAAADAISACVAAESECGTGDGHCPPEWRADGVGTLVVHVRQIAAGE